MTLSEPSCRAVLITGAARRIGRALAEDFGRRGWQVGLHYRSSADEAAQVAAAIRASGGKASLFQADLADADACAALMEEAFATLPGLCCLINNASRFEHDTALDFTTEGWAAHLDVNLRAPALLARDFAGQCPPERQGVIINIIDQRVWKLTPDFFSYTLSKAGLWTMTRTLAQALAPSIRVNAIGPGPTLASPRQTGEGFDRQCAALPLERGPGLDEICAAAHFILDTPSMTGQMIALDGGQHLAWQTPDVAGMDE